MIFVSRAVVFVFFLSSSSAFAQAGTPTPEGEQPEGKAVKGPLEEKKLEMQFEKAMAIPGEKKISDAEKLVNKMKDILKKVLGLLDEARKEKDVVKLNCVNENLTAVKGLLRISEQSLVALQEAVTKKETEQAAHEYTKITIAYQKIEQFYNVAMSCVGEIAKYTGETEVKVETPEYLQPETEVDVTTPPPATTNPQLEREPAASPYQ